jgi:sucrose-6-phosphate hydrolase SacC (GH32 family)
VLVDYELGTASEFGLFLENEHGDETLIGYTVGAQQIFVDRGRSCLIAFNPSFPGTRASTPTLVPPLRGMDVIRFHIFVDRSSIELFANGGGFVMSELVFPTSDYDRIGLFTQDGKAHLVRCDIWELESIWNDQKENPGLSEIGNKR